MANSVVHHSQQQQFTLTRQGHSAELTYERPTTDLIDFNHTHVAEALRGQGLGEELVRAGLMYAQEHQLRVRASCPFVQAFVQRHPEFQQLLAG